MVVEQKNKYKETEIGIIPEDWEIKNLTEISTLKARIGWQGLTTQEYLERGDYFLVTGTDFSNGQIIWDACHYVAKSRYDQDKNIQLKNHDILITKDGTIGKVAFVNNLSLPATLNSGVFVIRPKQDDRYDSHFLFYIFNSVYFKEFLRQLVAGSTINHLYQKDFISFKLPLPLDLEEQIAISNCLTDIDQLINSLEKLIIKKRNIKQGAMQELLSGKRRLPGFNGEWQNTNLGDIASFLKGKGLSKEQIFDSGKYKCVHYGELFTYYQEVITTIKSKTNQIEGAVFSETNDVLMPTSDVTPNGLAKASSIIEQGVILGGDILVIRPQKSILNGNFLAYSIRYDQAKILQLVSGSTVYHLYASDMAKYSFLKPPTVEEQRAITEVLYEIDKEIKNLEKQRNKYIMVKQGMMYNLLTGRIRLV